jgi:arsenate reductase
MRSGLVQVERDGRSMNYRADLRAFRGLITFLARDCCNGRPDLCGDIARLIPTHDDEAEQSVVTPSFNALFLCTHNSARSIMAEAILNKISKGRFNAYSAGSAPARAPQPDVLDRLRKFGHDVSKLRCKSWDEFTGPTAPRMDFVIALCDTHGQTCPDFGEKFVTGVWPLPDPADFKGSEAERAILISELYAMIGRRIEVFTSLPIAALDKTTLQARLDEIGDTARTAP